jgi:hypothetical protein
MAARLVRRSSIDLSPVSNLDHENAKDAVLYISDESIVADAIALVRAELRARERLAGGARVLEHSQALPKESCDAVMSQA